MCSAKDVAQHLVELSGGTLSPIRLLKMVYFAHGWKLGLQGKPLISDRVEAWRFGPVIPELYHAIKRFGNLNVDAVPGGKSSALSDEDRRLVKRILAVYGNIEGFQISELTHREGTPWSKVWKPGYMGTEIPNLMIREHFEELAAK